MIRFHEYVRTVIAEIDTTISNISEESIQHLLSAILTSPRIFVAGAGRSGFAVRAFAMRLMHLGLNTFVVGETMTPNITSDDLFIIGSASGMTENLVVLAEKATGIGTSIGLITTSPQSPLGNLATYVISIPASTPKQKQMQEFVSIQPMGNVFEQSLWLTFDIMSLMLMEKLGENADTMFARHANLE